MKYVNLTMNAGVGLWLLVTPSVPGALLAALAVAASLISVGRSVYFGLMLSGYSRILRGRGGERYAQGQPAAMNLYAMTEKTVVGNRNFEVKVFAVASALVMVGLVHQGLLAVAALYAIGWVVSYSFLSWGTKHKIMLYAMTHTREQVAQDAAKLRAQGIIK